MKISGTTKVCALIGDPVKHSLSPVIHNAAFEKLNLNFVYVAFKVVEDELKNAIKAMKSLGVHGLNVTMPLKRSVMEYLDEVDSTARSIMAVNTILNDDGKMVGYNTDGIGALRALKEKGININGIKIVILGAGNAGKAIAFYLAKEAQEIKILNRTLWKAEELAENLRSQSKKKVTAKTLSVECMKKELRDADLLINTTSVGMYPDVDESLVDPKWLRNDLGVMDIIYHPLVTKLVKDARSTGAKVVTGTDMLLFQGAASFEVWTNQAAPIESMKSAVENELFRG